MVERRENGSERPVGVPTGWHSSAHSQAGILPADRSSFIYQWPPASHSFSTSWKRTDGDRLLVRDMPESDAEVALDSRWPALFPSGTCLVTSSDGETSVLEKVVGVSIVNRFPYVMALSFCRKSLSERHYARSRTMQVIEAAERVSVQFIMPGEALAQAMSAIAQTPESEMATRLQLAGGASRKSRKSSAPILDAAYLVYEGRLVRPGKDFDGAPVHQQSWIDCGSHRIYNFEIETVLLAQDIADGVKPLHWRSLPVWRGGPKAGATYDADAARRRELVLQRVNYTKTYRPDYVFPSKDTVAFAGVPGSDGFSVLELPPLPADQVEVENDRARWPCFFPSSVGMITSEDRKGRRAAFPCGSTAVMARHPMSIGICVSYARINERYAPRASLDIIRDAGRFVCGVPIFRSDVLTAIGYLGNVSRRDDPDKAVNSGLELMTLASGFAYRELPINFDCRVVGEIRLGTHVMFLGQVERILLDSRLSDLSALEWCPWAGQIPSLPTAEGA